MTSIGSEAPGILPIPERLTDVEDFSENSAELIIGATLEAVRQVRAVRRNGGIVQPHEIPMPTIDLSSISEDKDRSNALQLIQDKYAEALLSPELIEAQLLTSNVANPLTFERGVHLGDQHQGTAFTYMHPLHEEIVLISKFVLDANNNPVSFTSVLSVSKSANRKFIFNNYDSLAKNQEKRAIEVLTLLQ